MSWLGRVRRLTRNFISHGFGPSSGGPPPAPPIIVGPCISQPLGDIAAASLVADPIATAEGLPHPEGAWLFGDVMIAGVLGDTQIEGTAINAC